jgi:hypothetical protein
LFIKNKILNLNYFRPERDQNDDLIDDSHSYGSNGIKNFQVLFYFMFIKIICGLILVDNFYNYLPQQSKNHSINSNASFNNFDSNSLAKNINATLKSSFKNNVSSSAPLSVNLLNNTNSTDSNWNLLNANCNANSDSTQNYFNNDLIDGKQNTNNYTLSTIHNQHTASTVDRFRSVLSNHRLSPYSTTYHNISYCNSINQNLNNSSNLLNYNQSVETDSNSSRPITSSPSSTSSSSLLSNSLNQFPSPSSK